MLPKKNRLPLRHQFNEIKKTGQLVNGRFLSILFTEVAPKGSPAEARFAFLVSNKIDPKAYGRNKIRRLLAEAVLQLLKEIKANTAVVVLPKRNITVADFKLIKQDISTVIHKAGLIQK